MRPRLLATTEVLAWTAASFAAFLALRIASLLLNLVDLAQCSEVCGVGGQALPLGLIGFGLAWLPFLLVVFVRAARRGEESWFLLPTAAAVISHTVAMVVVVRIIAQYGDADTRTTILAGCAALADVLGGGLLCAAAVLPPSQPVAEDR
ncbi:MAG: hypothetical protein ABR573_10935 [Candidatus Dormibacteria bacterium]